MTSYEEFRRVADSSGENLELHFGQVIDMGRPGPRHVHLQRRIYELLAALLGPAWEVIIEMPYRGLPHYESRSADIGVVRTERWQAALERDSLLGSPEMVVEVFSPKSNTAAEMAEKASLCLGTGAVQFWVVDERTPSVSVATLSGTRVFSAGERIPLGIADTSLAVDDIFA
jgi:Uma2 family endonuclease